MSQTLGHKMSRRLSLPWNDGTASGQMGVEADRVALVLGGRTERASRVLRKPSFVDSTLESQSLALRKGLIKEM